MTLLLNLAHSTKWYAMMKLIAASLSLAPFASGAHAQTIKEKYEVSERSAKQAAEHLALIGRSYGVSRSMRLRHHRKRPGTAPTPTPRPRPALACDSQATCLSLVLATGAEAQSAKEKCSVKYLVVQE